MLKLGGDFWMADTNVTANQMNTQLLVNSTAGSAFGLRIEAAMNAVYTNLGGSAAPGTAGLFGINATGSVNTALSPARLGTLSTPYTLSLPAPSSLRPAR